MQTGRMIMHVTWPVMYMNVRLRPGVIKRVNPNLDDRALGGGVKYELMEWILSVFGFVPRVESTLNEAYFFVGRILRDGSR